MAMKTIKILVLLLIFVLPLSAAAQPQTLSAAEMDRLAQELRETSMSPFCPGRTISSCPSSEARDLRHQIRTWLEQGYTPDAVRNQLLVIYGEDVRGTPQGEGFGIVGWVAPAVFVLLSVALVLIKLRRMKRDQPLSNASVDPALERRVQDALKQRAS